MSQAKTPAHGGKTIAQVRSTPLPPNQAARTTVLFLLFQSR
jgi:hypothetical protein